MQKLDGTTLGHYQIRQRLGRGGMSEVYLARDERLGRDVAIKVVNVNDTEHIERFRLEVATMRMLNHAHILPVFDCGEDDSWCYLVMPYFEQGTLRDRIVYSTGEAGINGALPLEEARIVLEQVASALHYAHDRGFVHRDIKPSNILLRVVDGPGELANLYACLADFGLAKKVEEEPALTQTGCLMGTPEYMAPELADDMACPSCDVYALGVVLYQMVTGHVPFTGSTPLVIYWKHIREQPQRPSMLNPVIPHPVEQVMLRALEKDPRRRFKTASELALAYRQALAASRQPQNTLLPVQTSLETLKKRIEVAISTVQVRESTTLLPPGRAARDGLRGKVAALAAFGLLTVASLSLGFSLHPQPSLIQATIGAGAQSISFNQAAAGHEPARANSSPTAHRPSPAKHAAHPPGAEASENQGPGNDHGHGHGHGH